MRFLKQHLIMLAALVFAIAGTGIGASASTLPSPPSTLPTCKVGTSPVLGYLLTPSTPQQCYIATRILIELVVAYGDNRFLFVKPGYHHVEIGNPPGLPRNPVTCESDGHERKFGNSRFEWYAYGSCTAPTGDFRFFESYGESVEGGACGSAESAGRVARASQAAGGRACSVRRRVFTHSFKSCSELTGWVAAHPDGLPEARSYWAVTYSASPLSGDVWEATYSLARSSYVADTHYSWPNMTPAETTALTDALHNLWVHEQGHLAVAAGYVRAHPTNAFTASNRKQAKAKGDRLMGEYAIHLDAREQEYDAVTGHGGHQSQGPSRGFPGGHDVVFTCPH